MKLLLIEAAQKFVQSHFPGCSIAMLAGSASRGEQKEHSDLDIVIIDDTLTSAYRESFDQFGWKIEAFLHTKESIHQCFENERSRGRSTIITMCWNGIILKDDGTALLLKQEANIYLKNGPELLRPEEIRAARYFLTDLLDDFIDADDYDEALVTINTLSLQIAEFVLRANKRWSGRGKVLSRELKKFDRQLSNQYIQALNIYYQKKNKQPFTQFVDFVLHPYGGRLFEGFTMGKPNLNQKREME